MKWLVTWIVITWFSIPCPVSPPSFDEFGREHISNSVTLGICYDSEITRHERYFDARKEAESFIKRAKASCEENLRLSSECDLRDFKIAEGGMK